MKATLGETTLTRLDGTEARLGDLQNGEPLLVVLLRHFG